MTDRIVRNYTDSLRSALTNPVFVVPGNRLLLMGGVYEINADIVLTIKDVTIMPYPGETPVIRCTGGTYYLLQFGVDSNNIILDGLVLENVSKSITTAIKITDGSHDITIRNCEIRNFTGQGILMTNGNGVTQNITIENCHIHHNGGSDPFIHNIYASIGGLTVRNCELDHAGGWGFHAFDGHDGESYTVENCYIHNNYVGIGAYYGNATLQNNVVRDNTIYSISHKYDLQTALTRFNTCLGQVVVDELSDKNQVIDIVDNVLKTMGLDALFLSGRHGMTTAHYNLIDGTVYQLNETYSTVAANVVATFTPITDTGESILPGVGNPAIGIGLYQADCLSDYGGNARLNPPTAGAWE